MQTYLRQRKTRLSYIRLRWKAAHANMINSRGWKTRHKEFIQKYPRSELSGLRATIAHHLQYFGDLNDDTLYGNEPDYFLMALTWEEHKWAHQQPQTIWRSRTKLKETFIKKHNAKTT